MTITNDDLLPKNIRKLKQNTEDLSILETLKYIERNDKLDLSEIIFSADVNIYDYSENALKTRLEHGYVDKSTGFIHIYQTFIRIRIDEENTINDLIELLEETMEVYNIELWILLDLETDERKLFRQEITHNSLRSFPFTNIKSLKIKNTIKRCLINEL